MSNFTVDYFISKFEAIPDRKWTVKSYRGLFSRCALGHCGEEMFKYTEESSALRALFEANDLFVTIINDGNSATFNQKTPKQRILAALRSIKEKQ